LIETYGLDIMVKKVKAHAGIELNEIADSAAKKRCVLANHVLS